MARTTWGPLSTDEQNQIEFAPVGEPGVLVAGTAGALLKRNADGTIGNSILSESGSVLTAAGRLVIGGGTVTASAPVLDLSQTWNYGAVAFSGIRLNVTDTTSSSISKALDLQTGGVPVAWIYKSGGIYTVSDLVTTGGALVFGSSFDARIVREAAAILALRNSTNAQTWNVYGTYTDASNYRRLRSTMTTGGAATIAAEGLGTGATGNTLAFSQNGAAVLSLGDATSSFNGALQINGASSLIWSSRARIYSPLDAQFLFANNTLTDVDFFLKFGVNTSAAAGIKRVGTVLQSRLNDDSAFATIQGKLRTDNAYVAGAVVGTGYVTITDSTGTAYRVPVLV